MAALTCIGLSDTTLPEVIKRTRDTSEEARMMHTTTRFIGCCTNEYDRRANSRRAQVRVLAYRMIHEKVPMKALSIEQRMSLIRDGLNAREEKVKLACEEMVCGWYTALCEQANGTACQHLTSRVSCLLLCQAMPATERPM
jgi:hypothetical protein